MQETTIAAIATAPGAGGIAVVRLSGAESYPIAARVFRPANAAKKWRMPKATPPCTAHSGKGTKHLMRGWPCFSARPPQLYRRGRGGAFLPWRQRRGPPSGGSLSCCRCSACRARRVHPPRVPERQAGSDAGRSGHGSDLGGWPSGVPRWPMPRWAVRWQKRSVPRREALTAIQAHLAAWVDFPEEDVPELDGDHLHRVLSGVKARTGQPDP